MKKHFLLDNVLQDREDFSSFKATLIPGIILDGHSLGGLYRISPLF